VDAESLAVAAVLESLALASNQFRLIAEEMQATLEHVQIDKPDWEFWLGFAPQDPVGELGVFVRVHPPVGSFSWSLTVTWRSSADRRMETEWLVEASQTWNFWFPYDGPTTLRRSERRPNSVIGLRAAISDALVEVNQWVAATDVTFTADFVGLDPKGEYGVIRSEVRRRLSI
jgi:hypothetical protein